MSFKAALFQGKNMIRVNHIKNKKVGPKDVLIRVRVCGICGTDMRIYMDYLDQSNQRPLSFLVIKLQETYLRWGMMSKNVPLEIVSLLNQIFLVECAFIVRMVKNIFVKI
jgi:hypothetical protein